MVSSYSQRNLMAALIGDGTPLLMLTALTLLFSGGFAIFLSVTGHFLPHDIGFLGMTAQQLCGMNQCKIVHFMFHDRVSFGGALISIGMLYLWLVEFPLRQGEGWAWWLYLLSCIVGFASFLAYLGYGYLDTWHAVATLFLLPCVLVGLKRSRRLIIKGKEPRALCVAGVPGPWKSRFCSGKLLLMAVALGMIAGGVTITLVGMTSVFVPQDLAFLGISAAEINGINPRLIPLIAHDRAGFGGAVCSCGVLVLFTVWCGKPCRSLWQVLMFAGIAGFSTAIGIHPVIGYTDLVHLLPAVLGLGAFLIAMFLLKGRMFDPDPGAINAAARETTRPAAKSV